MRVVVVGCILTFDVERQDSRSVNVILPTWLILGPLRWLVPYGLQVSLAAFARWQGKTPLLEKYIGKNNFEQWQVAMKQNKKSA